MAGAFKLAGYEGNLVVAPITSGDERIFLLEPEAFNALRDRDVLEQVLTQLLRLKVWVASELSSGVSPYRSNEAASPCHVRATRRGDQRSTMVTRALHCR